jgi:hypothetical protein
LVQEDLTYTSTPISLESTQNQTVLNLQEQTSEYRFQRLQNPVFRYDFKLGNYMPDEAKRKNPFLYTTIHNLTTGVRKPELVYSKDFIKFIKGDLTSYLNYYNKLSLNSSAKKIFNNNITEVFSSHSENDPFNSVISHSSGLYNFIFLLSEPKSFINYR